MTYEAENDFAPENVAGGFGDESETVNAADLYTSEENDASEQTDGSEQTDAPVQEKQPERTFTTEQMTHTVQERVNQLKRGAAYQLGRELLDEYMRANNVNEADALAQIRDERIKAKAAEYKENPERAFEELLRQQSMPRMTEEEAQTSEAKAGRIYAELTQEIADGRVPQDFDITAYLSDRNRAREFLDWREKLGIESACNLAMRLNAAPAQTKAERNRELPRPIGTNNGYNPQPLDFENMTSEQFREFEKKIKRAANSGKRVQF